MYWTLTLLVCFSATLIAADDKFHVLSFWMSTNDAAHMNFIKEANKWFPEKAGANGFTFTISNNWNDLNANNLKKYQVVLFLDDVPYSDGQKKAFQQYIEGGGGWMGFHAAAFVDNPKSWPWFHTTLLGAGTYKSNTWFPTKAILHVDDPNHPAMKGLPQKFTSSVSEWYAWQHDLRQNKDIDVLASVDKSSFPLGTDPNQQWRSGYYPIIWSNKKYKAIYCNFGHNAMDYAKNQGKSSTFASADQNKFLFQALHWLAGK